MRLFRNYIFFSFLLISVLWGRVPYDTLVISASPWSPYTDSTKLNDGIASSIVREAFDKVGIPIKIIFRPWGRAYQDALRGNIDGSILWRKTDEREELFYFSDPVLVVNIVFFHRTDLDFNWNSLNDLANYRIGVVHGFNYDEGFDSLIDLGELQVQEVTNQELNIKKIYYGRIDITPIVELSGHTTVQEIFAGDSIAMSSIIHQKRPLAQQELHLILSKSIPENERIIELFNEGLRSIQN